MYLYKKDRLLVNSFENISSFYNYIEKTPRRRGVRQESEQADYDFTGTHSL